MQLHIHAWATCFWHQGPHMSVNQTIMGSVTDFAPVSQQAIIWPTWDYHWFVHCKQIKSEVWIIMQQFSLQKMNCNWKIVGRRVPKKFQYLTRAEEDVITRLRIGHTKATKAHILSRGNPDYVSPLWSGTDYWPYAPGVYSVTGKSWRILHSWLIEYSLWDNSWDLHCRIPARSRILLPEMNGQTFHTIPHLNNP